MQIVIPKWWAHNVKDWESLWVKTDYGEDELNAATCALINYLAVVEVAEINDNNVEEVWRRIAVFQALFGSLYSDQENAPLFLTRTDVYRHIGIETEVKGISWESFCSRVIERKSADNETRLPCHLANGNRTFLYAVGVREPACK